jgi:hypothetical protein
MTTTGVAGRAFNMAVYSLIALLFLTLAAFLAIDILIADPTNGQAVAAEVTEGLCTGSFGALAGLAAGKVV